MPAATITPVLVANAPTSITDLTAGPTNGNEWSVNVRVANQTAGIILYRLYLTITADNTQTSGTYRAYDYPISANDAKDMEVQLLIPNGYKLQHKANATGLSVSVTGRTRTTA